MPRRSGWHGLVVSLLPDEPEATGLLALMLLHDARREARVGADGDLVLLEDQDRSRWDADRIAEGRALVERALPRGRPGPYQLQAAIAALHDEAPAAADTDWQQIAALYRRLVRIDPSPVVELNLAVAVAMADGPAVGLAMMDGLAAEGRWRAIRISTPPEPTCCGGSGAGPRRPRRTGGR